MIEYFKINADCTCWMKRQFWTSMEILKGPLAIDGTLNKFYLTSSWLLLIYSEGLPHGSDNKESACRKKKERRKKKEKKKEETACNAGDLGSIPGSERSPGERNGKPLQYSCLENSMDRSLAGYSPWSCKELDVIGRLTLTFTNLFSNLFRNVLLSFFLNGNKSLALTWRL